MYLLEVVAAHCALFSGASESSDHVRNCQVRLLRAADEICAHVARLQRPQRVEPL